MEDLKKIDVYEANEMKNHDIQVKHECAGDHLLLFTLSVSSLWPEGEGSERPAACRHVIKTCPDTCVPRSSFAVCFGLEAQQPASLSATTLDLRPAS